MSQEIGVGPLFLARIAQRLVRVCPQDIDEEVIRHRTLHRIGLREGGGHVTARELQQAEMVARIGVEAGELGIGAQGHREKELDAVLLARFRQDHHTIE